MSQDATSTTRLRHVGRTLREHRERDRLILSALQRRLERSASSLSKIENGLQWLRDRDLRFILEVYGVPKGPEQDALLELARQDRQHRSGGWWNDFDDILSPADVDYASLEQDASAIDSVDMHAIPGLFQTEDYAAEVIRSFLSDRRLDQADRKLAFRMERQRILYQPTPPRLRLVVDEAALRRTRGGDGVMRAQLLHLEAESERENIMLQVLPLVCPDNPGISETFSILSIGQPDILHLALIDTLTDRRTLDHPDEVALYRAAFARASGAALSESDSRELIRQIALKP